MDGKQTSILRKKCSVPGCKRPHSARDYYQAHYQRWQKHGSPGDAPIWDQRAARRFYEEVVLTHEADECVLWPYSTDGYGYGTIHRNQRVHRMVCEAVHGPPPSPKHQAAHSCGNPSCCAKRHLRWATPEENSADRWVHGTVTQARLTADNVRDIRALKGQMRTSEIGRMFGVHPGHIRGILRRRTWAWLG